jgi:hypothetical protein
MIRSGISARFTPPEVEEFRQIGLHFGDVKHQGDIEQEVSRWAYTLAVERFDLLEKIASAMAKVKGVKLPLSSLSCLQVLPGTLGSSNRSNRSDA